MFYSNEWIVKGFIDLILFEFLAVIEFVHINVVEFGLYLNLF